MWPRSSGPANRWKTPSSPIAIASRRYSSNSSRSASRPAGSKTPFANWSSIYDSTLSIQRNFRSQMAYPAIQFVLAVLVLSGLIWVLGILAGSGKAITTDPTGLGLTGTAGALTFMFTAFGIVGGILFALKLTANNVKWRARMEGILMALPGWGGAPGPGAAALLRGTPYVHRGRSAPKRRSITASAPPATPRSHRVKIAPSPS